MLVILSQTTVERHLMLEFKKMSRTKLVPSYFNEPVKQKLETLRIEFSKRIDYKQNMLHFKTFTLKNNYYTLKADIPHSQNQHKVKTTKEKKKM